MNSVAQATAHDLAPLANELGVSADALHRLGTTPHPDGWETPERDADGERIGTSIRRRDGGKRMVSGSQRGLTYAAPLPPYAGSSPADPILVVEGASDAAAGLDLGYDAVGRPSATGGREHLRGLLRGRYVVVVGERDEAGERGAEITACALADVAEQARIVYPPEGAKDLRQWYVAGATREDVDAVICAAEPYVAPSIPGGNPSVSSVSAAPADGESFQWPDPQPLPSGTPDVEPFNSGLLPDAFRPWIDDIAERIQCPPDYPAVAAMVALAGIVGRQVAIRPKRRDDWMVVPNLFGAVIGRPGVMKSPALAEPLKPLKRREIEAKQRYEAEAAEHETAATVAKLRKKEAEKAVARAIRNGGDLHEAAKRMSEEEGEPPTRTRYLANDPTVEKLGELLNENPRGLTVHRDELVGLLRTLDKEGREGDRAFYLEAWNGTGRYTWDRIGRGTIDIDAACVSILGGIQPGPLSDYLRGAAQGGKLDDGLIQRFQLAVWPDVSREWRNVDRWPDRDAKDRAYRVFERLDDLNPYTAETEHDSHDPEGVPYLRFDRTAQEAFDQWRADLEHRVRSGDEHPAMEAHLAKYRSLIPSLALLIHMADVGGGPVGVDPLHRAIRWGRYLESHARRLYAEAVSPDAAAARALAERIISGDLNDGFTLREVYQHHWSGLATRDEARRAVEALIDLDWLAEQTEQTGGRPRTRHQVNPVAKNSQTPPDQGCKSGKSPGLAPFAPFAPPPPQGSEVFFEGESAEAVQADADDWEAL